MKANRATGNCCPRPTLRPRHTEDVLGVELAGLLHDLTEDGHGRVHRVRDDADQGVGAGTVVIAIEIGWSARAK